jgi:hypothetical protein
VDTIEVAEADEALGLVLGRPDLDPIGEPIREQRRVGKPVGGVAVQPPARL